MKGYVISDGNFGFGRSFYKDTVYVTQQDAEMDVKEGQTIEEVWVLSPQEFESAIRKAVEMAREGEWIELPSDHEALESWEYSPDQILKTILGEK